MSDWIVKYWLNIIFGAIIAGLGFAYRQLSHRVDEQEAIKLGMMALLWDRLYQIYVDADERGYISVDGLKNAENIYEQYHRLGGNGTGTELYERIRDLPLDCKTHRKDLKEV